MPKAHQMDFNPLAIKQLPKVLIVSKSNQKKRNMTLHFCLNQKDTN